jgi:cytosine/adenosine deaminase-related metal-dependent hydrolase
MLRAAWPQPAANLLAMTDDEVPGFLAELSIPGIVDAHVHFLPDSVQDAVWRWFDRLTPPWPVTYRASAQERLATLTRIGVRHHTALAYAHRPGMLRFLNEHTLGLAGTEPAVIPTFTIFPEPGVGAETARCLTAGGRAVKVHLQVGGFDATDPLLDEAWGLLQEAGPPIILHAGAVADGSGNERWCGPEPVRRLLDRFPGLRLVIAHLGAPDYDAFVGLAEEHAGVWLDTAMVFTDPPYLGPTPAHLIERVGALGDRIVFGSDFPTIPHAFAAQISGLAALGHGDEWLRKVLWGNGVRLFAL